MIRFKLKYFDQTQCETIQNKKHVFLFESVRPGAGRRLRGGMATGFFDQVVFRPYYFPTISQNKITLQDLNKKISSVLKYFLPPRSRSQYFCENCHDIQTRSV